MCWSRIAHRSAITHSHWKSERSSSVFHPDNHIAHYLASRHVHPAPNVDSPLILVATPTPTGNGGRKAAVSKLLIPCDVPPLAQPSFPVLTMKAWQAPASGACVISVAHSCGRNFSAGEKLPRQGWPRWGQSSDAGNGPGRSGTKINRSAVLLSQSLAG